MTTLTPVPAHPTDASTDAIEVQDLRKRFGDRVILDGVGFRVPKGVFAVLLGPSGGGKSTLFRCLTRLVEPDSGSIRFESTPVTALRRAELVAFRRRIGFVFQQFNLIRRLTAVDNVLAARLGYTSLWRTMIRRFPESDRQLALACLDRVHLLDQAYQRADRLSGGQQQRVAIARAFAQQGNVILADEPISSLDPESAENVLTILRDATRERGQTVLCSLHQVDLALRYADVIIALKHGRVMYDGPPAQFSPPLRSALYAAAAPLAAE